MLTKAIFRENMFVKAFSYVMAVSAIVVMGALGWMVADRRIPIQIISAESSAVTVRPGGKLEWKVTFIQHRRCRIYSERFLIDREGKRYPLPPLGYQAGVGPVGEQQHILLSVPIPTDIAYGTARYESTTSYRCNLLHHIWPVLSPYNPVFFEVVSP